MADTDLQAMRDRMAAAAPADHSLRTASCPSLPRILERAKWTPEEREHAAACPYCQRMLALDWREPSRCPGLTDLARYALDPATSGLAAAMAFHLEHDLCVRCNRLLKSKAFAQYVAFHLVALTVRDEGARIFDSVMAPMPQRALDYLRVVLDARLPIIATGGPAEPHHVRTTTVEDGLEMESVLDDRGNIVARVFTKNADLAGRNVELELSTPQRTLTAVRPLLQRARSWVAETTFALDAEATEYVLEGGLLPVLPPAAPEALAEADGAGERVAGSNPPLPSGGASDPAGGER